MYNPVHTGTVKITILCRRKSSSLDKDSPELRCQYKFVSRTWSGNSYPPSSANIESLFKNLCRVEDKSGPISRGISETYDEISMALLCQRNGSSYTTKSELKVQWNGFRIFSWRHKSITHPAPTMMTDGLWELRCKWGRGCIVGRTPKEGRYAHCRSTKELSRLLRWACYEYMEGELGSKFRLPQQYQRPLGMSS